MTYRRHLGEARSPLVVGVILLVIGIALLAANFGFRLPIHLWRYWPFVLIVPGLVATVRPSSHMSRPGGIWLLAMGIYGAFGMYEPFGLGWRGAWPIFIVATGFNMILSDRREPRGGSDPDPAQSAANNHRSSDA